MNYGYVRVSTQEQNVTRQVEKMRALGIKENNIYIDHASGKNMNRPEWIKLNKALQAGDTLYIDSLDRLGRNYDLVINEWRRLTREVGIDIITLDLEVFDTCKFRAMGDIGKVVEDMLLSLLSYVAEAERKKIKQRQAEGIKIAKRLGKYKGSQKTKFDENILKEAQIALSTNVSACAKFLGVSRQTVYNMIDDGRLNAV